MPLFAMAIPIAPGKTDQFRKFIGELNGARRAEFVESRKKLGVRERTFLQHSPHGDMVVVTLEGANPTKAFAEFGQGTDAFTTWFKKSVAEIHGIDLGAPPPGPMPEQIVDSQ
jgi:LmbE family N-acetylglucosaminyl deacetylase